MTAFGDNLRNLRLSRGYTQEELAERLNSNQASITAWERGIRMPPYNTLERIANQLNVPLSTLISIQDTGFELDADKELIEFVRSKPSIQELLKRARFLSDQDLVVILNVVRSMTKDVCPK